MHVSVYMHNPATWIFCSLFLTYIQLTLYLLHNILHSIWIYQNIFICSGDWHMLFSTIFLLWNMEINISVTICAHMCDFVRSNKRNSWITGFDHLKLYCKLSNISQKCMSVPCLPHLFWKLFVRLFNVCQFNGCKVMPIITIIYCS